MERVNQLERDLKALKNKVSRLEKNGGRNKNGGDDAVTAAADPVLAPAATVSGVDTREKEGGIGKFLDGIFGTKAPEDANNEMRDVAGSMTGGRARSAKNGRRRRRHRNNKKSRKNKRTAKRGGTGAGCAKRNARNNKNKKNTRRNKNQRRRNTRRYQNGGG